MRRAEQSGVAAGPRARRRPASPDPPSADLTASDALAPPSGGARRGRGRKPGPGRRRRARRAALALARALGLACVFAGALGVGAFVHLGTPAARRATRVAVNAVLANTFEGRIVVGEITAIDLEGAEVLAAEAFDPRGERVVRVEGVRAQADLLGLLRDLVLGRGDLDVRLFYVRVEHADVVVELRGERVTLEETFTPRERSAVEVGLPAAPSRKVRVSLPKVEIARGYVHGIIAPPRALDADVSRLLGSILVGPEGVTLDVERSSIVERGLLPATMRGTANYHLRSEPMRMWSTFAGKLGEATVVARAEMEGDYLRGAVDVPRATPEEVSSVFPGAPFAAPVTARVFLEGPIPHFDLRAELSPHEESGLKGRLEATGGLDAEGPLRLDLEFDARRLDPRFFAALAPEASVDAEGEAWVELGDEVRAGLFAKTEPLSVLGTRLPAADVHVALAEGLWSGRAALREPGMPTEVAVALLPNGSARFDVRVEVPELRRAPRLGLPASGAATLRASGALEGGELSARLEGELERLSIPGPLGLRRGALSGTLSGPLSDPSLDLRLDGRGLALGPRVYERAELRARGPLGALEASAKLEDPRQGRLEASARLDPIRAEASGLRLSAESGGEVLRGSARRVGRSRGGLAVEDLELEGGGLGKAEGSLALAGGELTGSLRAEAVDLERLGRLVGLPQRVRGTASVDASIERTGSGRKGHLHLQLEGGELAPLSGISAHLAATFEGEEVRADALLRLVAKAHPGEPLAERCEGVIAAVRMTRGKLALPGPLADPGSFAEATGAAELALEDVDLRCVKRLVPAGLPVGELGGRLAARLDLVRRAGERFASIENFALQTRGLEVEAPRGLGDAEPAWVLRGLDFRAKGELDGATGRAEAALTASGDALLVDAAGQIDLDLAAGFDGKRGFAEALARAAEGAPISGTARVPRSPFSALAVLPAPLRERVPPLAGEFRAEAYLAGTTRAPKTALTLQGFGVVFAPGPGGTAGPFSVPLDATAVATYDLRHATLDARFSQRGREVAHATGLLDVDPAPTPAPDAPKRPAPPFRASLDLRLLDFPLGEVPFLADRNIGGHASGRVRVEGLGESPEFEAVLDAPDLQIGEDVYFERGRLALSIARRAGSTRDTSEARLELVAQDGGWLDASAFATVDWEDGVLPKVDPASPADFFAKASRFRIATFQPLVAGVFSKIDGYLDGDVRFGFARAGAGGSVDAAMTVTEGVFHVPQLGQEFRDATATLVAQPPEGTEGARPQPLAIGERLGDCGPGEHTIRLRDVSARGITGQIAGRAFGCLDGKLAFVSGGASLTVPKGEEVPLTLEGVPLGRARGSFDLVTHKEGRTIDTALVATRVHVELPPGTARDVQSLEPHADVEVVQPLGEPAAPRAGDALRWVLRVALDRAELEGNGLDVRLSSSLETGPRVELSDETRVSGAVAVVEPSTFEVFGKTFEIERGLVRLRPEDPSNPYLNVRAHWDAPSGARVFVDYAGTLRPVTPEKLNFSSNPPRPPQEIISTLILGDDLVTPRQSTPRAEPGAGGVAAGVGGEIAAAQFNALLSGIAPLSGFSTSIGTTEAGRVRTSVAYELSDRVRFIGVIEESAATRTGGNPPPGASTNSPGGARGGVGVDLKLSRGWSLRTTFGLGTAPTVLDLLWQHRY